MLRFLKYLIVFLFIGFIVFRTGTYLFRKQTLNTYNETIRQAPFDVLIIPGIPYDTTEPNEMLRARMHWAKHLYQSGVARNLIFSGDAVHTAYIEGCCMKTFADSMGISPAHTFSETRALHGTENVDYGIALAKELGFKTIAVATDPFQSFYLERYEGKTAVPYLPFAVDCMKTFRRPLPPIDVSEAFVQGFVPLKERAKEK